MHGRENCSLFSMHIADPATSIGEIFHDNFIKIIDIVFVRGCGLKILSALHTHTHTDKHIHGISELFGCMEPLCPSTCTILLAEGEEHRIEWLCFSFFFIVYWIVQLHTKFVVYFSTPNSPLFRFFGVFFCCFFSFHLLCSNAPGCFI